MWLARKVFLAQKREAEQQRLAAEAKLAMEARVREEARIKEENRKEELRIKQEQEIPADDDVVVEECIKEVANPVPAVTVRTEVGILSAIVHLLQVRGYRTRYFNTTSNFYNCHHEEITVMLRRDHYPYKSTLFYHRSFLTRGI